MNEHGDRGSGGEPPGWEPAAFRALLGAASQVRVIGAATPRNLRDELERLSATFSNGQASEARFSYGDPVSLGELRRALEAVAVGLQSEGALAKLYAERARELGDEAALCERAGQPGFWEAARRRFAWRDAFDEDADRTANAWLGEPVPRRVRDEARVVSDDESDPASLITSMRRELGRKRLPLRVVVNPNLASLAATGDGIVQVAKGLALSARDVERTVRHEVDGHVMPRCAAQTAALGIFAIGTARGVDDQEGRALAIERRLGFLDFGRRREIALRHVAARSVEERADFVTTVRLLRGHGAALRDALRIGARVHRGGGLAREVVYLPALLRVEDATRRDAAVDRVLGAGRVAVEAAPLLARWVA